MVKTFALVIFCSFIAMTGAATSASLTFQASTSAGSGGAAPVTGNLEKFDPNLGQLNSVAIVADISANAQVTCAGPCVPNVVELSLVWSLGDGGPATLEHSSFFTFVANAITPDMISLSVTNTDAFVLPALPAFIGPGPLSLFGTGQVLEFGANNWTSSSWFSTVKYQITYDFTPAPIPLPGALGMMLAALGGLIGLRKFRRG